MKKALKKYISFCYTQQRLGIYHLLPTFQIIKNQVLKCVSENIMVIDGQEFFFTREKPSFRWHNETV